MMEYTGCDFVMIGRAALGNPWIFREMIKEHRGEGKTEPPTLDEIKNMIVTHYNALEENKGEYIAVREMRKFIGRYLKGIKGGVRIRRIINGVESGEEFRRIITEEL